MIEEALRLFQHGRFHQCLEVLDAVLAAEPTNIQALRLAGTARILVGRPREAIGPLLRATRDPACPVEIYLSLAEAFEALGRPRAAELALRSGLLRHPEALPLREQRARLLVRLRRPVAAEVEARHALTLDAASGVAQEALGLALFQQRRLAEAERVLSHVVQHASWRAASMAALGRVRERLGNTAGAARALRGAANALPQDGRLALRAARLLFAVGEERPAKTLLRRAVASAIADPGLLLLAAEMYAARGEALTALRTVDAALATAPRISASYRVALLQGQCQLRLGDAAAAGRHFSTALKRAPLAIPALLGRAEAALAEGRAKAAIADLRTALAQEPGNAAASLKLGALLAAEGNAREALPYLRPAMEEGASAADALLLGQCLYREGKPAEALEVLRLAERRDPDLPDLGLWLSRAGVAAGTLAATDSPFTFQGDRRTVGRRTGFLASLHEHLVVVNALMHRHVRSKFGRHRLGYLMAVLPPMVSLGVMIVIFGFIRQRQPGDMPLGLFLMTGLISLQVFNAVRAVHQTASRQARRVLFVPRVSPFDVRVAAMMVEFVTQILVTLIFAVLLSAAGFEMYLDDPLQVLGAVGVLFLLGSGVGMIMEVAKSYARSAMQAVDTVLSRYLFMTSGIFFSVHDLPPDVRPYALINPLLHVIEYVRNGTQDSFPLHDADIRYPIAVGAVLLLFGLVLESRHRARLLGK